jgi:S1-C subfamily serine protease
MVARSKADRPYGSFPRLFGDVAVEAPPKKPGWRARIARVRGRFRRTQLLTAGAIAALSIVLLNNALTPAPARVSPDEMNKAIKDALASATPKPNVAIAAYTAIKESTVQVKTRSSTESVAQTRGAGFLLDTGGQVVTSLHVVKGAADISVIFFDGEEAFAVLDRSDAAFDIAVLAVAGSGHKPVTLASPKDLKVGDEAFIVGSPLGQPNSLSVGVISRLGSTMQPSWQTQSIGGLIQFDAVVYPANSGGPLVNRRGDVVGIVLSDPTGMSGVGFAIPIDGLASAAGSNPF